MELSQDQVRRKEKAYQTHRNVYAHPRSARAMKAALAKEHLYIPEFERMDDQEAAVQMEEWYMEWISRERGKQAGRSSTRRITISWTSSIIFPA